MSKDEPYMTNREMVRAILEECKKFSSEMVEAKTKIAFIEKQTNENTSDIKNNRWIDRGIAGSISTIISALFHINK